MISCTVNLSPRARLLPVSFVSAGGRPVAWLEIEAGGGRVGLYGAAADMRALAAAAVVAAEQADGFGGVGERLRAAAGANGTG
jgi:hypothetical protein